MDVLFVFDKETSFDSNYMRYLKRFVPSSLDVSFYFNGENTEELTNHVETVNPKVVVLMGYFDLKYRMESVYKETFVKNEVLKKLFDPFVSTSGKFGKILTMMGRHGRYYPFRIGKWFGWVTISFHPQWTQTYPGTFSVPVLKEEMSNLDHCCQTPPNEWVPEEVTAVVKEYFAKNDSRESLLECFGENEVVAWDIETTGLSPFEDRIISMAFASGKGFWCRTYTSETEIDFDELVSFLYKCKKVVVHNLPFEYLWLRVKSGKDILDIAWEDTMAIRRLHVDRPKLLSLEETLFEVFGFKLEGKEDRKNLVGKTPYELKVYNTLDSFYEWMLYECSIVKEEEKEEYNRLIRLSKNLAEMYVRGMVVDEPYLDRVLEDYQKQDEEIRYALMESEEVQNYGKEFNPNSSKQILEILLEEGMEVSTTQTKELSKLKNTFAENIVELRKLKKNMDTYVKNIQKSVGKDKLLHISMNPFFVVTGRLSSIWHNIPKRKDGTVRGCVIPKEGEVLVEIDYAQLEVRGFAMMTKDPVLIKQIFEDFDMHGYWADRFLEAFPSIEKNLKKEYGFKTSKEVRKYFRGTQKTDFVFSSFYGAYWKNCLHRIELTTKTKLKESVVESFQKELFTTYKKVVPWQNREIDFYNRHGYVNLITGRRRMGPSTKNEFLNSLIQGPSSDIVTRSGCIIAEKAVKEEKPYLVPNIIIHDALKFRFPVDVAEESIKEVVRIMVDLHYSWINVPLKVEVTWGFRWNEMETYGEYSTLNFPDLKSKLVNC